MSTTPANLIASALRRSPSPRSAPAPPAAQEVTLKAVNAFQEGTYFARNFERFVKKVNDEGKGIVQINYIGGPKAIPTFEQRERAAQRRGRPGQHHHLVHRRRCRPKAWR